MDHFVPKVVVKSGESSAVSDESTENLDEATTESPQSTRTSSIDSGVSDTTSSALKSRRIQFAERIQEIIFDTGSRLRSSCKFRDRDHEVLRTKIAHAPSPERVLIVDKPPSERRESDDSDSELYTLISVERFPPQKPPRRARLEMLDEDGYSLLKQRKWACCQKEATYVEPDLLEDCHENLANSYCSISTDFLNGRKSSLGNGPRISDVDRRCNELRRARDIQCIRMAQASKALEEIKKRYHRDWLELLMAESVLLKTSEIVKLLTQIIRDDTSYSAIPEPTLYTGTVKLSEVRFPFQKQFRDNLKLDKHHTEFFVLTVSCGPQLYASEFITGETAPLVFAASHVFENVKPDFEITVRLFCLRLRTSNAPFWEKFVICSICPTSKIIYEDLLTHQQQETTVLRTSFKLCAETVLTRRHINETSRSLTTKPEVFGKLDKDVEFSLACEDLKLEEADMCGFLDVSWLNGDRFYWEKKWCVLKGTDLQLYNYPQDVYFGKPYEQINLEYCFGPVVTKVDNCPKRRCFQLKTGRPTVPDSSGYRSLKTKPNFALRKFFFAASNRDEYLRWTTVLEKILRSLKSFKKLVFGEEYYEYMKQ